MAEARHKATLTEGKLAEAYREAEVAREAAKVAEEAARVAKDAVVVVAAAAADKALDVSLQVGFKILHQALVCVTPDFDVDALDAIITLEMMVVAIAEAEAEQEVGQVAKGSKALTGLASPPAMRETDAAEAPFVETQVLPSEGNAMGAAAKGEIEAAERAPAEEDEVVEVF